MSVRICTLVLSALALSFNAIAQSTYSTEKHDFKLEQVIDGLDIPWGLAFVTNNQMLVTERDGDIFLVNVADKTKTQVSGQPIIKASGQGGLLDVAIPTLAAEPLSKPITAYFTYSKSTDNGLATTLASAQFIGQHLINWQDILVTQSATSKSRHFGSRITFDNDGHLFFGIGDRAERDNGQDTSNHAASILRINLDGSVPKDNPFVGKEGALPEIWSYGHRNPQGLVFDTTTNRLWEIEHGPRGGDEINLIKKGNNYGWAEVSQGKEYWGPVDVGEKYKEGMTEPKKVYTPSIAPGSLALYNASAFPNWQGNLFAGSLKLRHLNRVEIDDKGNIVHEERLLESFEQRIRDVITGPDGFIYISTDSGQILRLKPI